MTVQGTANLVAFNKKRNSNQSLEPTTRTVLRTFSGLFKTWWRHQTETFSALLVLCAGNSPVISEIPSQRPVRRSFDVLFDQFLNKWLSKTREAGDLRRHQAHYDVIVMVIQIATASHVGLEYRLCKRLSLDYEKRCDFLRAMWAHNALEITPNLPQMNQPSPNLHLISQRQMQYCQLIGGPGPLLLIRIDFHPSMDKLSHAQ